MCYNRLYNFSDAPKINYDASSPAEVTVLEGERVELSCTFTGEPTPSVTWLRGDDKKGLDGLIIKMSFLDTLYSMIRITDIRIFCRRINKTPPYL